MLKITKLDSGAARPWSQDLGSGLVLIVPLCVPSKGTARLGVPVEPPKTENEKKEEHEVLRLKDLCSREFWPS